MYNLKITSNFGMQAIAVLDKSIVEKLPSKAFSKEKIKREELLNFFGYPKDVGNSISGLNNLYEFIDNVLTESSSNHFKVMIEAIPVQPKINPIFKSAETLPEENRQVTVIFKDKYISSNIEYCQKHESWHSPHGDLKVNRIHQWAYSDELYPQLNLPEITEEPKKESEIDRDISEKLLKTLLFAALISGSKSKSEIFDFPFKP
ncbi:hypothetical protein I5735_15225 [Acinetobacter baumannii]|nr:hypothetical protein [Acinetobacter baumannii]